MEILIPVCSAVVKYWNQHPSVSPWLPGGFYTLGQCMIGRFQMGGVCGTFFRWERETCMKVQAVLRQVILGRTRGRWAIWKLIPSAPRAHWKVLKCPQGLHAHLEDSYPGSDFSQPHTVPRVLIAKEARDLLACSPEVSPGLSHPRAWPVPCDLERTGVLLEEGNHEIKHEVGLKGTWLVKWENGLGGIFWDGVQFKGCSLPGLGLGETRKLPRTHI